MARPMMIIPRRVQAAQALMIYHISWGINCPSRRSLDIHPIQARRADAYQRWSRHAEAGAV